MDAGHVSENTLQVYISKTTTLHVRHVFLYISLPLLHEYDGETS